MKRLGLLIVCFATLAFTSCNALQQVASSNTAAQALGQTCGNALIGLYNAYRTTGTINLGDATNLSNALALATCYTQISQNRNNSDYRKAFLTGLVLNGAGLITNQNSNSVYNALLGATGLTNISQNNTTTQNNQTANNTITPILKTIK